MEKYVVELQAILAKYRSLTSVRDNELYLKAL